MQIDNDITYGPIINQYKTYLSTKEYKIYVSLINDSFYNIMYYQKYEKIFHQMILNGISSENISIEEKHYLLDLIDIYYNKLHDGIDIFNSNSKLNIFKFISLFNPIITHDGNFESLLKSTEYSNTILNKLFPIYNNDNISFYELIQIIIGDKINYSLYDLIYGINEKLPPDISFSKTDNLKLLEIFQYMRIIDIIKIFLQTYIKQSNIDVNTDQFNYNIIEKSILKTQLADSFDNILNKNSTRTLFSLLLLNKLNIFYKTEQTIQNNTSILVDIKVFAFFQNMAQHFYDYINDNNNNFIGRTKQLLTDIFQYVSMNDNRRVSYIINKFRQLYGKLDTDYNNIFNKNTGLIYIWLRQNSKIYNDYKNSTLDIEKKTISFYDSFFDNLKKTIMDIVCCIMDNITYTNPIEHFLTDMFDYAKKIIYSITGSSFIGYIGSLCIINNYEFITNDITVPIIIDPTIIHTSLVNKSNYYGLFNIIYQCSTQIIASNQSNQQYKLINYTPNGTIDFLFLDAENKDEILNYNNFLDIITDVMFKLMEIINILPTQIIDSIINSKLDYKTILLQILIKFAKINDFDSVHNELIKNISFLHDYKLEKMKTDNLLSQNDQDNFINYRNNLEQTYQNILNKMISEENIKNNVSNSLIKYKLNDINSNINMSLFARSTSKICIYKPYNIVKHFNSLIDDSTDKGLLKPILIENKINVYPLFSLIKLPYKYDDNVTIISTMKSKPVIDNCLIETTIFNVNTGNMQDENKNDMIVSFQKDDNNTIQPIKININLTKEDINYN